jgi:ABC-type bacteriocin/lantibiotic exporter with double-glycine peptidase domain
MIYMNKRLKLILATFTKQKNLNDCGIACLTSLCNYAGFEMPRITPEGGPFSLLQLRKLASEAGLQATCVRMDLDSLIKNKWPCILHVENESGETHFIVHYEFESKKGQHLIGDPDRSIEFLSHEQLLTRWVSGTALFIEDLKPRRKVLDRFFPWTSIREFRLITKVFWLSIPFLTVVASFLGLAVSFIIQKAVEPGFMSSGPQFFIILFALLLIILFAKCSINYIRQKMLMDVIAKIGERLSLPIKKHAYRSFVSSNKLPAHFYLNSIADIQKINQAVSLLIGVVFSDGILLVAMLAGLWYFQPMLILVQLGAFFGILGVVDHFLPMMMIFFGQARPVAGEGTNRIIRVGNGLATYKSFSRNYLMLNRDFSEKAKAASTLGNKINLSVEGISALNLIIVLYLSLGKLQAAQVSYEGFLMSFLLCYGMSALMGKICTQLFAIAQGAQRLKENLAGRPM